MNNVQSRSETGGGLSDRDRAVLAAIEHEELIGLLRELIAIPSENPPGAEGDCARYLARFLEERGLDCRMAEVEPGRPNLYAEHGSGSPVLVLNGHVDTVPRGEGWTIDPFGGALESGKIFGRGACDMKGGIAAMCATLLALRRAAVPLSGRLALHLVVDEEATATGSKLAAAAEPADYVIVTEASAGQVITAGNGQLNLRIEFAGKAAHSSRPERGHNAIHDAAAFVSAVEAENARFASAPYAGIGPATYSVGVIEGGLTGSIVADRCVLILDRRVLPSETLASTEAAVEELLQRVAAGRPGMSWQMSRPLEFPPIPPTNNGHLAGILRSALHDLGGPDPDGRGMRGATDAAWYAERGIPVVIFGPGDGGTAHQPDEYIAVDSLIFATQALSVACARLLHPSDQ
jgi:acetylornithine deacetylase/succinyl-diaminopimelate desuccinylase family protein